MKKFFNFLLLLCITGLRAWALKCFWWWFITPTFELKGLSFSQALGLSLFYSLLSLNYSVQDYKARKEIDDDDELVYTGGLLVAYVLILGMGWLYHWGGAN